MPGLNSSRSSRYSPSQRHQTVGSPPARGGGCARGGARTGDAAGLCAVADVEHADGADVGAVRVVQERAHLVLRQLEVEELEQEAERRRRALVEAALLRPAVRPRLDVRHLLVDEVHDLVEGLEDVEALEVLALRDLRVEVVVEVKDVGVRAADLEDRALDADLRHVLREPVAVDTRPDGHAELARVREAHPTGCARSIGVAPTGCARSIGVAAVAIDCNRRGTLLCFGRRCIVAARPKRAKRGSLGARAGRCAARVGKAAAPSWTWGSCRRPPRASRAARRPGPRARRRRRRRRGGRASWRGRR